MDDLERQSARAESLHAEGAPLGVVVSAGLPFRAELFTVARKVVKDAQLAEDVLQQVHLDLWRVSQVEGWTYNDLRSFLRYLTKLRAIDVYRRTKRYAEVMAELAERGEGQPMPIAISIGTRDLLRDVAKVLTTPQWNLWVAVRVCGMSQLEAAGWLGVTEKAIERRLARIGAAIEKEIGG